jgi:DNA gyrase/topoisomerase IV subunit A
MEQVEQIRAELKQVMEDMDEVLNTLEQIEREKNASEDEIEKLRDQLASLHRGPMQQRYPRHDPPSRPPAPVEPVTPEPEPEPQGDATTGVD